MIEFQDWGLIDYAEALSWQEQLVDKVKQGELPDTIVFCTHPPTVTLGRGTKETDVYAWKGPIYEIQRGGRATYHGPNQLICYPILNLKVRGSDIRKYINGLEHSIIDCLSEYGVQSEVGEDLERIGVWVKRHNIKQKIASIGVGVKNWVSYHGVAINLYYDQNAFEGINPCGFKKADMISLEEIISQKIEREKFQKIFGHRLLKKFTVTNLSNIET